MTGQPLVTVLVNCYNQAPWVVECLESVRAQTYGNVQLVVMDDCSTDGSAELLRDWLRRTGTDAEFVVNPTNLGLARTRNAALARAEGEYLSWVSSDDVWAPTKLEIQVERLGQLDRGVGVLYSDADVIDPDGARLPNRFLEIYLGAGEAERPPEGDLFDRLILSNFIPSLATLVRRQAMAAVGGYDPAVPIEDWDLWLRLARVCDFAHLPGSVASWRVVPNSRVHTFSPADLALSSLLVAGKHLGYRATCDPLLRRRIVHGASDLYAHRHPAHRRYLWRAFRTAPSAEVLAKAVLATAGVSHRRAKNFGLALRRGRARVPGASETRSEP